MPDIDIDVSNRDLVVAALGPVVRPAVQGPGRRRHASGVYLQDIPANPLDGMAAMDYGRAAERGYVKLDVLNNSIYAGVRDEAHLQALLARDPDWRLLEFPEAVERLAHLAAHFRVVRSVRPRSLSDLALCLALIRPGKRHLVGRPRAEIEADIWTPDTEGYQFKRSHAFAYALSLAVQMNLMSEALEADMDRSKNS